MEDLTKKENGLYDSYESGGLLSGLGKTVKHLAAPLLPLAFVSLAFIPAGASDTRPSSANNQYSYMTNPGEYRKRLFGLARVDEQGWIITDNLDMGRYDFSDPLHTILAFKECYEADKEFWLSLFSKEGRESAEEDIKWVRIAKEKLRISGEIDTLLNKPDDYKIVEGIRFGTRVCDTFRPTVLYKTHGGKLDVYSECRGSRYELRVILANENGEWKVHGVWYEGGHQEKW